MMDSRYASAKGIQIVKRHASRLRSSFGQDRISLIPFQVQMAHRIKVGDYFEIPLTDGRFAYCQHVNWNDQMGFLVQVLERISDQPLKVDELLGAKPLFPPVFVGLRAALNSGRWKKIGNRPVTDFEFPLFRATSATKPGKYENWWLFDGFKQRFIGTLPLELRSLEVEVAWGYEMLESRIATGQNLFDQIV